MFRHTLPILLFSALALTGAGQTAVATPQADPADQPVAARIFSRVGGLFSGDLPQLDLPGTFKVIFRPHFGDLVRRDYMRVDTGLRWSVNEDFEFTTDAGVFFNHGLGGENDDGYGIGRVRLGSRYVFEQWPKKNYETSLGLNVELPTGHPPVDMTDGHYHVSPTVIVQHNWVSRPRLTTFGGVGLDILGASSIAGTWGTNQPHDDSMSFTAGGIWDVGQLKWSLRGTYATTGVIGDETEHFFYLQPGVLWYVPSRFTFHSKTQWIIGLSANTSWGPDGFDLGIRSRVRAEITFRQVMEKMRRRSSTRVDEH